MKIYDVNWSLFYTLLLPTRWRTVSVDALFYAVFSGIQYVYDLFLAFRNEKADEMAYNSQVCYLRGLLNDKFDPAERRIYIENMPRVATVWVYREGEEKPLMIQQQSQNNPVMIISAAAIKTQKGFNVYVPNSILNANENAIKAYLNKYKLVTTYYKLIGI